MAAPYAGIFCRVHKKVDITRPEYDRQMGMPGARWTCPICRQFAEFDDERFEELNPEPLDIDTSGRERDDYGSLS